MTIIESEFVCSWTFLQAAELDHEHHKNWKMWAAAGPSCRQLVEAGSEWKHAGDCQASPGAAMGELGLGQGRQQMLPQHWHAIQVMSWSFAISIRTLHIHIHIITVVHVGCLCLYSCVGVAFKLCYFTIYFISFPSYLMTTLAAYIAHWTTEWQQRAQYRCSGLLIISPKPTLRDDTYLLSWGLNFKAMVSLSLEFFLVSGGCIHA